MIPEVPVAALFHIRNIQLFGPGDRREVLLYLLMIIIGITSPLMCISRLPTYAMLICVRAAVPSVA